MTHVDSPIDDAFDIVKAKQLAPNLYQTFEKLGVQIEQLEENMTFGKIDNAFHSNFRKVELYKKQMLKVYEKLCTIIGKTERT